MQDRNDEPRLQHATLRPAGMGCGGRQATAIEWIVNVVSRWRRQWLQMTPRKAAPSAADHRLPTEDFSRRPSDSFDDRPCIERSSGVMTSDAGDHIIGTTLARRPIQCRDYAAVEFQLIPLRHKDLTMETETQGEHQMSQLGLFHSQIRVSRAAYSPVLYILCILITISATQYLFTYIGAGDEAVYYSLDKELRRDWASTPTARIYQFFFLVFIGLFGLRLRVKCLGLETFFLLYYLV